MIQNVSIGIHACQCGWKKFDVRFWGEGVKCHDAPAYNSRAYGFISDVFAPSVQIDYRKIVLRQAVKFHIEATRS